MFQKKYTILLKRGDNLNIAKKLKFSRSYVAQVSRGILPHKDIEEELNKIVEKRKELYNSLYKGFDIDKFLMKKNIISRNKDKIEELASYLSRGYQGAESDAKKICYITGLTEGAFTNFIKGRNKSSQALIPLIALGIKRKQELKKKIKK